MASGKDFDKVRETFARYAYLRDNGFLDFIAKADKCDSFFQGDQWEKEDVDKLRAQRRPALTINKILPTVVNVLGSEAMNRTEALYKPRSGLADEATAVVLSKLYSYIADQNNLRWLKSEMLADGLITSRGFLDVQIDFSENLLGEVKIALLNPRDVAIDSDADDYDPDGWSDVITTRWVSLDESEVLFGSDVMKELKHRSTYDDLDYDLYDIGRQRFGDSDEHHPYHNYDQDQEVLRNIRVLQRQHMQTVRREFFVDLMTGDMQPIPDDMDDEQIGQTLAMNENLTIIEKLARRPRWTTVAGDILIFDDWSLYEHFTVVPFFPYFRRGKTIGMVENLISPQELLNKVSSQELHVVNTSANSGWKVKQNALTNMDIAELEQRGAESGIVIEVTDMDGLDKISPNQVPSGLDRISYKAEEHIKSVSGLSDYQTGFAREDVSAKSVVANQRSGSVNLAKMTDNLQRSEAILAKRVLSLIQSFYTDYRVIRVTQDQITGQQEEIEINADQYDGSVLNDVSVGKYDVIITSQPERDNFEESQFDQAVMLRQELGIPISDELIIETSKIQRKREVIESIQQNSQSPEAQRMAQLELEKLETELMKLKAEAMDQMTRAQHNQAKTQRELAAAREKTAEFLEPEDQIEMARLELEQRKQEFQETLEREKLKLEEARIMGDLRVRALQAQLQREAARENAEQKKQEPKKDGPNRSEK